MAFAYAAKSGTMLSPPIITSPSSVAGTLGTPFQFRPTIVGPAITWVFSYVHANYPTYDFPSSYLDNYSTNSATGEVTGTVKSSLAGAPNPATVVLYVYPASESQGGPNTSSLSMTFTFS